MLQTVLARARAFSFSGALRKELVRQAVWFALALLLSFAMRRIAPLSVGFVAAVWMSGNPIGAFLGAALGALFRSNYAVLSALGIYVLLGGFFLLLRPRLSALDKLLLACCAQVSVIPMFFLSSSNDFFLWPCQHVAVCVLRAGLSWRAAGH